MFIELSEKLVCEETQSKVTLVYSEHSEHKAEQRSRFSHWFWFILILIIIMEGIQLQGLVLPSSVTASAH